MKKLNIVITGRRNVGKSSLINALTGQRTAIVSDIPGTTTDPVKKSYEIPGFATIVFTDTAGIDDIGHLGKERVNKTRNSILQADMAILVITENKFEQSEKELCIEFQNLEIPFVIIHNKSDILPLNKESEKKLGKEYNVPIIDFSTVSENNTDSVIDALKKVEPSLKNPSLLGDIIRKNDIVILITPIDSEAPTGRLILPQVQTIRDILDNNGISIVLQPEEITYFFQNHAIQPKLVITDSQVFKTVAEQIPQSIPLTSFSILMARNKGNFEKYIEGTYFIDQLQENDKILIMESCSHHVSCEDIGRFKLPALLRKYTGKNFDFNFISGLDPLPENINEYKLVIQCGGCMVTKRQLYNRIQPFINAEIPVTNYGMAIAFMNGIFERSVEIFNTNQST